MNREDSQWLPYAEAVENARLQPFLNATTDGKSGHHWTDCGTVLNLYPDPCMYWIALLKKRKYLSTTSTSDGASDRLSASCPGECDVLSPYDLTLNEPEPTIGLPISPGCLMGRYGARDASSSGT